MTAAEICIAAELACIDRLSREDGLKHIEDRLLKEPNDSVRRALKRAYHSLFERKELA
ncbi:hypothetical protein [Phyllobacterium brassicacearum]|uniref:hypothetical protein n=1 Tax=Phyllobacterium brassicacearum TaxID=314235 RepID=UPI0010EE5DD7|nr:hypothetical protein [Phyllobacterium brassicacearum]TDQ19913.1 hypothetical protein DEV91_124108 [Phyllobacterium brassicacearum]